jgi:putative PIN family toxin of toxin-antitoxin system
MISAVLDTNTIISGLFWQGPPRTVLQEASLRTYALLMSDDLLAELQDVLSREKFSKLRNALGKIADEIIAELLSVAELAPSAEISQGAVRDPKDRIVLACAVGGQADYIVSGDKDLLVLSSFQGIVIIDATHFLQALAEQSS